MEIIIHVVAYIIIIVVFAGGICDIIEKNEKLREIQEKKRDSRNNIVKNFNESFDKLFSIIKKGRKKYSQKKDIYIEFDGMIIKEYFSGHHEYSLVDDCFFTYQKRAPIPLFASVIVMVSVFLTSLLSIKYIGGSLFKIVAAISGVSSIPLCVVFWIVFIDNPYDDERDYLILDFYDKYGIEGLKELYDKAEEKVREILPEVEEEEHKLDLINSEKEVFSIMDNT